MLHLKPGRYDPVQEEIENRKPFFRRQQTRLVAAFALVAFVWLILRLLGFDVPFPFHFW